MRSCFSCGSQVGADDVWCATCGSKVDGTDTLGAGGPAGSSQTFGRSECASCGGVLKPGDGFCRSCGLRVQDDHSDEDSFFKIEPLLERAIGSRIELTGELGRGGMGIVLAGRDRMLGRRVAIKVLSPAWANDRTMVERFEQEARTIASLRHPSIVRVHDVGRVRGLPYFVMDFLDGVPLSQILRQQGALPIDVAKALLYQVGSALAHAHRGGVVHRDVKPANIIVGDDGVATVMDFGISKVEEAGKGLTRTGVVMGTAEYMSPEQAEGARTSSSSDQYSLGVVAYAMVTGHPPFTGPTHRVLIAHLSEDVPLARDARPDCPVELSEVLARMLAKTPGERWPGIREALGELGLRPLLPDDPALVELRELVQATRSGGPGDENSTSGGIDAPTSLTLAPPSVELKPGDRALMAATAILGSGTIEESPSGLRWESSDTAVALIDPDTGELVAMGAGQTTVQARIGDVVETIPIQIKPAEVSRIELDADELRLTPGETRELAATTLDRRGVPLAGEISWASEDPTVATVDAEGRVEAKGPGRTRVLATCSGAEAAVPVAVTEAAAGVVSGGRRRKRKSAEAPSRWPLFLGLLVVSIAAAGAALYFMGSGGDADDLVVQVDGVPLSPGQVVRLEEGGVLTLVGEALGAAGEALELDVVLESIDPEVATVGADNQLTGVAPGRTSLLARAEGLRTAWPLVVEAATVEVQLRGRNGEVVPGLNLQIGQSVDLLAGLLNNRGDWADEPGVWSSGDTTVMTVDSTGQVIGTAPGRTQLVASIGEVTTRIPVAVAADSAGASEAADAPQGPETGAAPSGETPDSVGVAAGLAAPGILVVTVPNASAFISLDGDTINPNATMAGDAETFELEPGRSYRLRIENPGFQPLDTIIVVPSGDSTRIRAVLRRLGSG